MKSSELPETIRAFISIELPEPLALDVTNLQERLEADLPQAVVRWVPRNQTHLTLKFLGSMASADVGELVKKLEVVVRMTRPFVLRVEGLGCFPGPSRPRVIWVGLSGDLELLKTLQAAIEIATQPWSEKEERPFRAHVTIGRVREVAPRIVRQIGQRMKDTPVGTLGEWQVTAINLMRSQLSPKGAVHTVLASLPLAG